MPCNTHKLFKNEFRIIELQEIVRNLCHINIFQNFKNKSRIDLHFEARKRVHRNLIIFNQNSMKLLYVVMYQQ